MSTALQQGTVIGGRYHLDRLLGEGGMGAVWSATHSITGGRVALKFIKAAVNDPNGEMKRRFLREARSAALVEHPNVVSIRDVLEHDDTPVIVMDLLVGETLAQRLAREGTLGVGEAARIVLSVVGAVGAAHEVGLIHRDLKPENIFLAKSPHGEMVRVLDFGIAKLVRPGPDGATTAVTQSGAVIGTPAYMAPEQLFGERDLDYRVDVWALGVILYEVLVGERPVDGENYGQIAKRLLSHPMPQLAKKRPDVPPDLSSLVDRMLARERNDRMADLREAADVLALHTTHARPSFGPPRSRPLTDTDSEKRVIYESGESAAVVGGTLSSGARRADPNAATMQSEPGRAVGNAATLEAGSAPKNETGVAHVTSARTPSRSYTTWIVAAIGVCTVASVAVIRFLPVGSARDAASASAVPMPVPVPATPTPIPAQPTISTLPVATNVVASTSASEVASASPAPIKPSAKPMKGAPTSTAAISATAPELPIPMPSPTPPAPTASATATGGSGLVTKPPF